MSVEFVNEMYAFVTAFIEMIKKIIEDVKSLINSEKETEETTTSID